MTLGTKTEYILLYPNGKYVKRDDSTGPMSTGGYPFPVNEVEKATTFKTLEDAVRYANTGQEGFKIKKIVSTLNIEDI